AEIFSWPPWIFMDHPNNDTMTLLGGRFALAAILGVVTVFGMFADWTSKAMLRLTRDRGVAFAELKPVVARPGDEVRTSVGWGRIVRYRPADDVVECEVGGTTSTMAYMVGRDVRGRDVRRRGGG